MTNAIIILLSVPSILLCYHTVLPVHWFTLHDVKKRTPYKIMFLCLTDMHDMHYSTLRNVHYRKRRRRKDWL